MEFGWIGSPQVGSHVRYECKTSDRTVLKFMTDGILLREIQQDFLLRKVTTEPRWKPHHERTKERKWIWWAHTGGGNALAFKQPT